MRTFRSSLAALALLFPVLCAAAEPKTIDEAIAEINGKAEKIETYSADFDAAMNMGSMAMNFGGTMKGKGAMMNMTTNMDMMQQKIAVNMILDASNIMWMDMDMGGMRQVMKMDMTKMAALQEDMMGMMPGAMGGMQNDPRKVLAQMQKMYTLSYAGKEKLGDQDVYVVEGQLGEEAKAGFEDAAAEGGSNPFAMGMGMAGEMIGSVRMKFGANDGFIREMQMLDQAGTPWMTQTYKNLKLNESLDDALFTYTPAEGVMVMDMTEMMGAMMEDGGASDVSAEDEP